MFFKFWKDFFPAQHRSFSLSSGLTPIIEFQNVERTLLGPPHSNCKKTNTSNNYNNQNFSYYQKHMCEFRGNFNKIKL